MIGSAAGVELGWAFVLNEHLMIRPAMLDPEVRRGETRGLHIMATSAATAALLLAGCGSSTSVKDYTCKDYNGSADKQAALQRALASAEHSEPALAKYALDALCKTPGGDPLCAREAEAEFAQLKPGDKPYAPGKRWVALRAATYAASHRSPCT